MSSELSPRLNAVAELVPACTILADIGSGISVIFRPVGFGKWRPAVATITASASGRSSLNITLQSL